MPLAFKLGLLYLFLDGFNRLSSELLLLEAILRDGVNKLNNLEDATIAKLFRLKFHQALRRWACGRALPVFLFLELLHLSEVVDELKDNRD